MKLTPPSIAGKVNPDTHYSNGQPRLVGNGSLKRTPAQIAADKKVVAERLATPIPPPVDVKKAPGFGAGKPQFFSLMIDGEWLPFAFKSKTESNKFGIANKLWEKNDPTKLSDSKSFDAGIQRLVRKGVARKETTNTATIE